MGGAEGTKLDLDFVEMERVSTAVTIGFYGNTIKLQMRCAQRNMNSNLISQSNLIKVWRLEIPIFFIKTATFITVH